MARLFASGEFGCAFDAARPAPFDPSPTKTAPIPPTSEEAATALA